MKKRSKIIALVTTLCLCLSMFTIGVLAATSASLSVTSTLNFESKGVYVMVDASLKQGADVATAAVLTEGAPTGQATYKAYSYSRIGGTGADQHAPDGSASSDTFLKADGSPAGDWAIGDITYTSENVVVVYEFLVSNYSPFEVTGTVEGISEALTSYTDQLSITTYTGTTSADATATGSPTYTFSIPARTNETTPGVTCYKIAVTLNDFMNELATGQIEMNVNFEKAPEPVYDYFEYSYSDSGNSITGFSDNYLTLETKPETLVIPNTDAEGNNITAIEDGSSSSPTFQGLKSSKVIIQEGITSIGSYAFRNCTTLTSVSLPSSLTSIGQDAFSDCSGLTSVSLPNNLTSIGYSAFDGCSGLTGELVIPDGVTSIGDLAFYGCSSLTSLTLPSKLTSIGYSAFNGCRGLTGELKIPEGVTSIGSNAFNGCSGLTSVSLPSSLTSIGVQAFFNCSGLTGKLVIPEGVTSIGSSAFSGCSGLTGELVIPEGVTSIGYSAFQSCSGLTGELVIPEGVTSIGEWTFYGCRSLTSVSLPSKLTSIGNNAFRNCTSLKYIQITGNLTSPYTLPSGTWVKTDSATEPTDWTNTVTEILTTNSAGFYHQKSAWDKAS